MCSEDRFIQKIDLNQIEKNDFKSKKERTLRIDCIFFYYLSKELVISATYRFHFIKTQKSTKFKLILMPTQSNLIDYKWNNTINEMIREKCEVDHALSWFSTLGGAFSALGDYFTNCAEIAGKISVNQLRLALRLGDPLVAARCRLYFSLSLIQQKRFKLARYIVFEEFWRTKNTTLGDDRLVKMCKGIWSKLQYEYSLNQQGKLKKLELNRKFFN